MYTLAAGDEWGDLLLLHFVVEQDPGSLGVSKWDPDNQLTVLNTTQYQPTCCLTDYTFEVKAFNVDSSTYWTINPNDFLLITADNPQGYIAQPVQDEFGIFHYPSIGPEQQATGEVAFEIPTGDSPLFLEYNDSADLLYTGTNQIPRTTSWMSLIEGFNIDFESSEGSVAFLFGQANSPDMYDPGEPAFYSGNLVNVTIALTSTVPSNITIESVSASAGFEIETTSPTLPTSFEGSQTFSVTIVAPDLSYTGSVNFTVVTS